jgi:D-sedoheptulose 7-phosphate isomerase
MSASRVAEVVRESLDLKRVFFAQNAERVVVFAAEVSARVERGGRIFVFGNGGSAADAQHFAGELVGKFTREGRAIGAMALTTDTSILTAVGNDYGYEFIFRRQIEAHGRAGDVAIGISTSGNSKNVIEAIRLAREMGLLTAAFTGEGGGRLATEVDRLFEVPSKSTPRIQEVHHLLNHILCELLETRLR